MKRSKASGLSFGDRMKAFEQGTKVQLNPSQPCIIRIDGHRFSVLTKKFAKPFDPRVHEAMIKTSEALIKTFMPAVVYTFSDEITLAFPVFPQDITPVSPGHAERIEAKQTDFQPLPFGNKLEKIISLSAGLASSTFSLHLYDLLTPQEREFFVQAPAHFDSRAFNVPKNSDIYDNLRWRQADCNRNSIGLLSHTLFHHSKTTGKSCEEQLKMQLEIGTDYNLMPPAFKFGTFVKKQKYIKQVEMNGEVLKVERTGITHRSGLLPSSPKDIKPFQEWLFVKVLEEKDDLHWE